jgi:two-component system NtrC family sensor kinase
MKARSLKSRILISFFTVIILLSVAIAMHRMHVVNRNIIDRAQAEVQNDLSVARIIYQGEMDNIRKAFGLISYDKNNLAQLQKKLGLDYLFVAGIKDSGGIKSPIARAALRGKGAGGTRVVESDELQWMGSGLFDRSRIAIKSTPKAKPTRRTEVDSALAIEYAMPLADAAGNVTGVLCGGKVLNRDFDLVDRIHGLVFENKSYNNKPIGTVTIFLDDVRIATNVLDNEGKRAIGTRVSDKVYQKVVVEGRQWVDRAFVVTDWYLTAYEPIRDISGKIVGVLYVGRLEKPFVDLKKNILEVLFVIVLLVSAAALLISYVLAAAITRPVTQMLKATRVMSAGDLKQRVTTDSSISELNELAASFNEMAGKLADREKSLQESSEKMAALNKTYLDLVGFVAHELKGILASTILNAYSVRDGFLGLVNFKQRRALDSITRNLDYFESTVKNFLNLSRMEKGEIAVNKTERQMREDVFDLSVDAFAKGASEKEIRIENNIQPALKFRGDVSLMQIVANNLVGNAVKYGIPGGRIVLRSKADAGKIWIEVYNDGRVIQLEEMEKLFKKFSRLTPKGERTHGTGLGLFITKEIVEKHGGRIWVEPRKEGNAFIFEIPI